jgi:prepilin-type N-terminal cleavage/methylation domain-containing protein
MIKSDERGFTLVEALVALAIIVLALAALYQALGGGLQAGVAAEQQWRAVEAAERLLTELGRSTPLRDGVTKGELGDGRRWTLRVEPFAAIDTDGPPPVLEGHVATVEVSRPGGRGPLLQVRTLVLGVKQ